MALGIPVLHDMTTNRAVEARIVLNVDDVGLSLLRNQIRGERRTQASRYRCGLCRDAVYISNSGTPHFAHYKDSGPACAWRAELPKHLDLISAGRFQGRQEGELHKRLLLTLQALCTRSSGFSDAGVPNETLFGVRDTGHRFPDLQATYGGNKIVFELQISQTYLPVISDREHFYRRNGIYLFWLFHDFQKCRERQTERDIIALRSRQAFELDDAAICASLEAGKLILKAHCQIPALKNGTIAWSWNSRLVAIDELHFDSYLMEALAADPWGAEAHLRNNHFKSEIEKFERYWVERWDWAQKLGKEAAQRIRSGKIVDPARTSDAVTKRALAALFRAAGASSEEIERIFDLRFHDLLDRLFFFRDGVNRFNNQDIAGAIDTVLENWPHFTDVSIAVLSSYGREASLKRPTVLKKAKRILFGERSSDPIPQCHDFDAVISLLCPKAAPHVRASAASFLDCEA